MASVKQQHKDEARHGNNTLVTRDEKWLQPFKHSVGIKGLDRGNAKPLADLATDGGSIQYNIPFFVGNLAIGEYTGSDPTSLYRGGFGSSLVTIWLGSHSRMPHMAGHMPDIMTFDSAGLPISKFHGKGNKAGAGGMQQALLTTHTGYPLQNPTYLRVFAGGENAICISAIKISGYDGFAALWTADMMIGCNNIDAVHRPKSFEDSSTKIQGYQPRCLWIDRDDFSNRNRKDRNLPHGVEFHIPSLIATPERQREWLKNPELLCNGSPRQRLVAYTRYAKPANKDFYNELPYFNPRLEFEKETLLDKVPERILRWRPTLDQISPSMLQKEDDFVENDDRTEWQGDASRFLLSNGLQRRSSSSSLFNNSTETETEFETLQNQLPPQQQQMLHPSERKLVISRSSISARSKCLIHNDNHGDIGDGSDYLSLQEKIYCDIVLKTQYPQCDDVYKTNCFDIDMMMLRSELSVEEDLVRGNVTAAHILRARDEIGAAPVFAPLYGIPYSNFLSIG